jgi:hypothetical protein
MGLNPIKTINQSGHTDLSEVDTEGSTPEPMVEDYLQQNINSSNSCITVDSKDLQQHLIVFSNSGTTPAQENEESAISIAHAQEEAAWSLVSMGRGNARNNQNRQLSVSAPTEEPALPNYSQSFLIPKVIESEFGFI